MKAIKGFVPTSPFAVDLKAAVSRVTPVRSTRAAYWLDARHWLRFCEAEGIDPVAASATAKKDRARRVALVQAVSRWIDGMTDEGVASKTRVRRINALSSLHDELRRTEPDLFNPFSIENGPRREKAVRERPTPAVEPLAAMRLLGACAADQSPEGTRDAALLRLLWATGMRRSSAVSLTRERLVAEPDGSFYAEVVAKGSRIVRVLVRGRAADALREHLARTEGGGAVFRRGSGRAMNGVDVWRVVRRRARQAGITARVTAHGFRASFLTFGEAGLEERADAAGHADVSTTKLYDRTAWRGRTAFERMPEIEEIAEASPMAAMKGRSERFRADNG